ncbi:MAG: TolC family protein [Deltaproteobacteria bacterium]|jgi:outer membrane protein|nr:TolC family protein [Deltaproteobacteria bacterium]
MPAPLAFAVLLLAAPDGAALTLEAAVALALERTNDVIQAKEDLLLVDAEWLQAVGAVLPRLDLSANGGELFAGSPITEARFPNAPQLGLPGQLPAFRFGAFVDGQGNNYSNPQFGLSLRGTQLIYDGGKWWTAIARVDRLGEARRAALAVVRADVRFRVAQRYYELEKARQAESTLLQQTQNGEQQLERAQALLIAGRNKPADVSVVARNLGEDRINWSRQVLAASQARRALNLELGRDPQIPVELALGFELAPGTGPAAPTVVPTLDDAILLARSRRPELAQLDAEIAVKEKEVGLQRAAYFPVVNLEANYRRNTSRRPDRVFGDPTENYFATVDLTMRWNLFEGRATDGRVEAAEIALRKTVAQRDHLLRQISAEVEDRLQTLATQEQIRSLAEGSIKAAEDAVRLASGLYEEGRGTVLEVRDADLRLVQAKLAAINARLDVEISKEALDRALGPKE